MAGANPDAAESPPLVVGEAVAEGEAVVDAGAPLLDAVGAAVVAVLEAAAEDDEEEELESPLAAFSYLSTM